MALINAAGVATYALEDKNSVSSSAGAVTLDLNTSNIFTLSLTESISSIAINNVPITGIVTSFTLILTYTATTVSITWPVSVKWPAATAPTLTNLNGKKDIFSFVSEDGGTSWYGFNGGQNI